MASAPLVRAAQYLRMSTDQQQYSLDNQAEAIQRYARSHGFAVVQTYADGGKSGLSIKNRPGLGHLLHDIVGAEAKFEAVLVYDVSRWGRFQDSDEAAHYEFLCKSAGIPVHYCAEQFPNDGTLPSAILKALKRTMAGEFSRELSVKAFEGQKRLMQLGFRVGGMAGYGLRRLMVSSDRRRDRVLEEGEYKSLKTDRVVLVPGPPQEVKVVREIYRMFTEDRRGVMSIIAELNRRGLTCHGRPWSWLAVSNVLTKEKYVGTNVWGRTSAKLKSAPKRLPREQWLRKPGAFEPIIDQRTFDKAQSIFASDTHKLPNSQVLQSVRALLEKRGALSSLIIRESRTVPTIETLRRRFGGLPKLYELLGYKPSRAEVARRVVKLRERTKALRVRLMGSLLRLFRGRVTAIRVAGMQKPVLRLRSGLLGSPMLCAPHRSAERRDCWRAAPLLPERSMPLLLCRMNKNRDGFIDMHIVPPIGHPCLYLYVQNQNDPRLKAGHRLWTLGDFCKVAENVARGIASYKPDL
jgi:DNA invertase Pin-like site-specific DNA recombinase